MNKFKHCTTFLSVAGADPGGGAGIQADIKTASTLGIYATAVITAITEQNTLGVRKVHPLDPEVIRGQLDCLLDDICPDAIKIGMVVGVEAARAIAESISSHEIRNVVVDPIGYSSSGTSLCEDAQAQAEILFPIASLVTPNYPEAEVLLGRIITENERETACREICRRYGAEAVLFKGGHALNPMYCTDLLYEARTDNAELFTHRRILSQNTHGTGCTLSSAIACNIALGLSLKDACIRGINYLTDALVRGTKYKIGHGKGPVCHLQTLK